VHEIKVDGIRLMAERRRWRPAVDAERKWLAGPLSDSFGSLGHAFPTTEPIPLRHRCLTSGWQWASTMSRTQEGSIRRSAAVRIRICPACGSPCMRIVIAKPSIQRADLDECIYRCACGEEAVHEIMRPA